MGVGENGILIRRFYPFQQRNNGNLEALLIFSVLKVFFRNIILSIEENTIHKTDFMVIFLRLKTLFILTTKI